MTELLADRPSEAERSASARLCEQCRQPVSGRVDKKFCTDRCRTRFGRERRTHEIRDTISRLAKLAGMVEGRERH